MITRKKNVWDSIKSVGNEMSNQNLDTYTIHFTHIQTFWQHLIKRVRMASGYVAIPIFCIKIQFGCHADIF